MATTWLHFFMVAGPGRLDPTTMASDTAAPRTTAAVDKLRQNVGTALGTPVQFVIYFGSHELADEPYVDPNAKTDLKLIVPDNRIVIPGRD